MLNLNVWMKKPSLNDIATRLGVSKTLVSLVLNHRGAENGISAETERRVFELAEELGYQPNQVARGLRLGRSNTLGLIVSDISNTFFSRIGRAIEDVAAQAGYNVIFCSSDENQEKENNLIQVLIDRRVDGLILSPAQTKQAAIEKLLKENYPFVLIDRHFPDLDTNYVMADNYQGAWQAVDHLLQQGYRKIGHITVFHRQVSCMQQRWHGYRQALEDHGISHNEQLVWDISWNQMRQEVGRAIREMIKPPDPVQAFFVSNNRLTLQVLDMIHELGLKIPDDLALVSFDDVDYFRLVDPPVTAVAQDEERIGAEAVQILLNILSGREGTAQVVVPVELKVRASCGSLRIQQRSEGESKRGTA